MQGVLVFLLTLSVVTLTSSFIWLSLNYYIKHQLCDSKPKINKPFGKGRKKTGSKQPGMLLFFTMTILICATNPTHPAVWPEFTKRLYGLYVISLIQPTNNKACVSTLPLPVWLGSKCWQSLLPVQQTVDTSWWVKGVQIHGEHSGSGGTWQRDLFRLLSI